MTDKKLEKVKNIYAFWGKFSSLYAAQDTITFLGHAQKIRKSAVQSLGLKKGDTVLEVACGSGRNFPYLIEAVGKEGKIIGVDFSEDMLRAAKILCERHGWSNITLVAQDAAELNLQKTNFDGVLSILGISAVPDWENTLQRCFDVLKVGGKLVVCDAKLFHGTFKFLNTIVRFVYSKFAAWDPTKNIQNMMQMIFGNIETKTYNFGTFFISSSIKK